MESTSSAIFEKWVSVAADSNLSQASTFDYNGNRLSDAAGGYAYISASNKMTSAPQGAVGVNAAGITTSDQSGGRLFTYGQSGRMLTATVGGNLAGTYSYDFQGHRASKVASGSIVFHPLRAAPCRIRLPSAIPARPHIFLSFFGGNVTPPLA